MPPVPRGIAAAESAALQIVPPALTGVIGDRYS